MLVLSRKIGEEVFIPEVGMTIKVIAIRKNGTVRLGLEAPKHLSLVRKEVADNIRSKIPKK